MDAELSARTGASINQLLQWFYGQEDKKEIWECESSLSSLSSFTNPTTTPGKGFAKGCCCILGSPRSLPFLKGIQVSLYIIPALFKTRFYHMKEKNNHWKKDPPGERGAGSPGKTLLQRETSYRATNSLREQERTWITGNMRARKKGVYG